ncbi:MAG: hypothetical protein FRX48_04539 [Lasallia pustulata]|uniref:Uncharacterized protein n=1 Tax=Lasallia pustulata TaxID=136370 RepID=A0A5M8PQL6_9LECA|nr:MAG: hypothetical protein FRX48_04539 [Lasallia pustulata]
MALALPPPNDKKRVKVYELRNNDWFDRGTGFCNGQVVNEESRIYVESEDQPERMLLETRIGKDDGYNKQQDTLIVWTEPNGPEMALSFQEAEGCAAIWEFVYQVVQQLSLGGPDDALSDDAMDGSPNPVVLPPPELGNLGEIEQMMHVASTSPAGRDSLSKFVINDNYIQKMLPLVSIAEDLEALPELHRLCRIMKTVILLNDTQIIEHVVSDNIVLGVVGALEYDPDFPNYKANHRQYLRDKSRYKEVVPIHDPIIKKKIHSTWRLQYLKDVVLARILDDPTFSVLNSLIFFNQVDIVSHLQADDVFVKDLFGIIDSPEVDLRRKKDAVCFIQQCCAIAKNLQAPARATLYNNFVQNGLLGVITFALLNKDSSIRVAGTDILVAMIDHDPSMVRAYIFKAINEKKTPLTDTLIELLLVEVDHGVKAQAADAIKVLLDPSTNQPSQDALGRGNNDFLSKLRSNASSNPQTESFITNFYEESAKKLFQPLKNLEKRQSLHDLTFQEISLFTNLVEILMFLIRQHLFRSKYFVLTEKLAARIAQLLSCPQKHLKLTALKFFRTCIGLQDEFYHRQIIQNHLFEPILNIVYDTMPRDNLLNSACLELFEFVKRENIKPIIIHVVENYREKLQDVTYVDTFQNLITRYDQMQGYNPEMESTLFGQEGDTSPARTKVTGNHRWQGVKEMDAVEEEYFNTSDDEEDMSGKRKLLAPMTNGSSPVMKPLVDYPDDDEEAMDTRAEPGAMLTPSTTASEDNRITGSDTSDAATSPSRVSQTPPERLSEKRRREEDEEDELGKLSSQIKRRNSSASSSPASTTGNVSNTSNILRRKKSFTSNKDAPTGKKIAISLAVKSSGDTTSRNRGDEG